MSAPTFDEGGYLELDGIKAASQDNNRPYTALNVPPSGSAGQASARTDRSGYDDVRVLGRTATSDCTRSTSTTYTRLTLAVIIVLVLADTAAVCYLLYRAVTAPATEEAGESQSAVNHTDCVRSSHTEDDAGGVVAFYARTGEQSGPDDEHEVIKFDDVILNVGGGYDCDCGKFTAPVAGVYWFGYEAMASSSCEEGGWVCVSLFRDDDIVSVSCSVHGSSAGTGVSLELDAGSAVWIAIHHDAPCHAIDGHSRCANKFSGHLVSRTADSSSAPTS